MVAMSNESEPWNLILKLVHATPINLKWRKYFYALVQGPPNVEHSCSNVRECSLFFENLNVRCSNVRQFQMFESSNVQCSLIFKCSKVQMFGCSLMFESSNFLMFANVRISKSSMIECSLILKCSKVRFSICSLMFELSNVRKFSVHYF